MSIIGLVDGNNFFVSCERSLDPSLEGRPVIVASGGSGCAIARSNEVKALGIKVGQPLFQVQEIIKKHNIIVIPANHSLYHDLSEKMMDVLASFSPLTEQYSIDEMFYDLRGMEHFNLREYGQKIVQQVKQQVGLPVSLGIASTKTLAKIANRFAKKYPAYNNVCFIESDEQRIKALSLTDICDVWGVGQQSEAKLRKRGITTAFEFTQMSRAWVHRNMTVSGERIFRELQGESCIEFETEPPGNKSISSTRTFVDMTSNFDTLSEAIANYAAMCAARVRKQNSCAASLRVFIRTNRHRQDLPQYSPDIEIALPVPTNSTLEIINHAIKGLKEIYKEEYQYKRTGVEITKIISNTGIQTNIFDTVDRGRHKKLMDIMDSMNDKYDNSALFVGSQGVKKKPKSQNEEQDKEAE